jgi:nitrate/nitrite transporter NarK
VLGVGFIAAILFAMALPAFPTEPLLCIALFAALGLVQGASFGAVPQLNKTSEDQALANGALAQAGNIGNLVGTPLLLSVAIAGGVSAMSALIVLCYLLAIAAHAFLAYRRRQAM